MNKRVINWEQVMPEVIKLRAQGKTIDEIAEITGISRSPIHKKLQKHEKEVKKAKEQAEAQQLEEAAKPEPVAEQEETQPTESLTELEKERQRMTKRGANKVDFANDEPIPFEPVNEEQIAEAICEEIKEVAAEEGYAEESNELPRFSSVMTEAILYRTKNKVDAVLNDPIAYELLKELIKQGVIY